MLLNKSKKQLTLLICGSILLLLLSGCEDAVVVSYLVPKSPASTTVQTLPEEGTVKQDLSQLSKTPETKIPPQTEMQLLKGMQGSADAQPEIIFSLPDGWNDAGSSGMRKANLRINDPSGSAEVTALSFPGDVGGNLANVNRWCGQIELNSIDQAQLESISKPITISHHRGTYLRLQGPQKSILVGILPFHGNTWFFKMLGDTATVLANELAMKNFLDSVNIHDTNH